MEQSSPDEPDSPKTLDLGQQQQQQTAAQPFLRKDKFRRSFDKQAYRKLHRSNSITDGSKNNITDLKRLFEKGGAVDDERANAEQTNAIAKRIRDNELIASPARDNRVPNENVVDSEVKIFNDCKENYFLESENLSANANLNIAVASIENNEIQERDVTRRAESAKSKSITVVEQYSSAGKGIKNNIQSSSFTRVEEIGERKSKDSKKIKPAIPVKGNYQLKSKLGRQRSSEDRESQKHYQEKKKELKQIRPKDKEEVHQKNNKGSEQFSPRDNERRKVSEKIVLKEKEELWLEKKKRLNQIGLREEDLWLEKKEGLSQFEEEIWLEKKKRLNQIGLREKEELWLEKKEVLSQFEEEIWLEKKKGLSQIGLREEEDLWLEKKKGLSQIRLREKEEIWLEKKKGFNQIGLSDKEELWLEKKKGSDQIGLREKEEGLIQIGPREKEELSLEKKKGTNQIEPKELYRENYRRPEQIKPKENEETNKEKQPDNSEIKREPETYQLRTKPIIQIKPLKNEEIAQRVSNIEKLQSSLRKSLFEDTPILPRKNTHSIENSNSFEENETKKRSLENSPALPPGVNEDNSVLPTRKILIDDGSISSRESSEKKKHIQGGSISSRESSEKKKHSLEGSISSQESYEDSERKKHSLEYSLENSPALPSTVNEDNSVLPTRKILIDDSSISSRVSSEKKKHSPEGSISSRASSEKKKHSLSSRESYEDSEEKKHSLKHPLKNSPALPSSANEDNSVLLTTKNLIEDDSISSRDSEDSGKKKLSLEYSPVPLTRNTGVVVNEDDQADNRPILPPRNNSFDGTQEKKRSLKDSPALLTKNTPVLLRKITSDAGITGNSSVLLHRTNETCQSLDDTSAVLVCTSSEENRRRTNKTYKSDTSFTSSEDNTALLRKKSLLTTLSSSEDTRRINITSSKKSSTQDFTSTEASERTSLREGILSLLRQNLPERKASSSEDTAIIEENKISSEIRTEQSFSGENIRGFTGRSVSSEDNSSYLQNTATKNRVSIEDRSDSIEREVSREDKAVLHSKNLKVPEDTPNVSSEDSSSYLQNNATKNRVLSEDTLHSIEKEVLREDKAVLRSENLKFSEDTPNVSSEDSSSNLRNNATQNKVSVEDTSDSIEQEFLREDKAVLLSKNLKLLKDTPNVSRADSSSYLRNNATKNRGSIKDTSDFLEKEVLREDKAVLRPKKLKLPQDTSNVSSEDNSSYLRNNATKSRSSIEDTSEKEDNVFLREDKAVLIQRTLHSPQDNTTLTKKNVPSEDNSVLLRENSIERKNRREETSELYKKPFDENTPNVSREDTLILLSKTTINRVVSSEKSSDFTKVSREEIPDFNLGNNAALNKPKSSIGNIGEFAETRVTNEDRRLKNYKDGTIKNTEEFTETRVSSEERRSKKDFDENTPNVSREDKLVFLSQTTANRVSSEESSDFTKVSREETPDFNVDRENNAVFLPGDSNKQKSSKANTEEFIETRVTSEDRRLKNYKDGTIKNTEEFTETRVSSEDRRSKNYKDKKYFDENTPNVSRQDTLVSLSKTTTNRVSSEESSDFIKVSPDFNVDRENNAVFLPGDLNKQNSSKANTEEFIETRVTSEDRRPKNYKDRKFLEENTPNVSREDKLVFLSKNTTNRVSSEESSDFTKVSCEGTVDPENNAVFLPRDSNKQKSAIGTTGELAETHVTSEERRPKNYKNGTEREVSTVDTHVATEDRRPKHYKDVTIRNTEEFPLTHISSEERSSKNYKDGRECVVSTEDTRVSSEDNRPKHYKDVTIRNLEEFPVTHISSEERSSKNYKYGTECVVSTEATRVSSEDKRPKHYKDVTIRNTEEFPETHISSEERSSKNYKDGAVSTEDTRVSSEDNRPKVCRCEDNSILRSGTNYDPSEQAESETNKNLFDSTDTSSVVLRKNSRRKHSSSDKKRTSTKRVSFSPDVEKIPIPAPRKSLTLKEQKAEVVKVEVKTVQKESAAPVLLIEERKKDVNSNYRSNAKFLEDLQNSKHPKTVNKDFNRSKEVASENLNFRSKEEDQITSENLKLNLEAHQESVCVRKTKEDKERFLNNTTEEFAGGRSKALTSDRNCKETFTDADVVLRRPVSRRTGETDSETLQSLDAEVILRRPVNRRIGETDSETLHSLDDEVILRRPVNQRTSETDIRKSDSERNSRTVFSILSQNNQEKAKRTSSKSKSTGFLYEETKSKKLNRRSNPFDLRSSAIISKPKLPKAPKIQFSDDEERYVLARQSSEDSIDKIQLALDQFIMDDKKEKKRTNSFKKIFKNFSRKDKDKKKPKKVENEVAEDNAQNESANRNSNTGVQPVVKISKEGHSRKNKELPEIPTEEAEKRYAQMHINRYNQVRANFELTTDPLKFSEDYVCMDNGNKYSYINTAEVNKYIDTSSSSNTLDSENLAFRDSDNSSGLEVKNEKFFETPPRAFDTYQNVQLVKPKANIPISSERPLPLPYQDALFSAEAENANNKNEFSDGVYGTVYDRKSIKTSPDVSISISDRSLSSRSPSLEGSKLKMPLNREKIDLQPRIRSPIPPSEVSTDKIIATELLKSKKDKDKDKRSSPSHQRLEIEIDYPDAGINRLKDSVPKGKPPISPQSKALQNLEAGEWHRRQREMNVAPSLEAAEWQRKQREGASPGVDDWAMRQRELMSPAGVEDWQRKQRERMSPTVVEDWQNKSPGSVDDWQKKERERMSPTAVDDWQRKQRQLLSPSAEDWQRKQRERMSPTGVEDRQRKQGELMSPASIEDWQKKERERMSPTSFEDWQRKQRELMSPSSLEDWQRKQRELTSSSAEDWQRKQRERMSPTGVEDRQRKQRELMSPASVEDWQKKQRELMSPASVEDWQKKQRELMSPASVEAWQKKQKERMSPSAEDWQKKQRERMSPSIDEWQKVQRGEDWQRKQREGISNEDWRRQGDIDDYRRQRDAMSPSIEEYRRDGVKSPTTVLLRKQQNETPMMIEQRQRQQNEEDWQRKLTAQEIGINRAGMSAKPVEEYRRDDVKSPGAEVLLRKQQNESSMMIEQRQRQQNEEDWQRKLTAQEIGINRAGMSPKPVEGYRRDDVKSPTAEVLLRKQQNETPMMIEQRQRQQNESSLMFDQRQRQQNESAMMFEQRQRQQNESALTIEQRQRQQNEEDWQRKLTAQEIATNRAGMSPKPVEEYRRDDVKQNDLTSPTADVLLRKQQNESSSMIEQRQRQQNQEDWQRKLTAPNQEIGIIRAGMSPKLEEWKLKQRGVAIEVDQRDRQMTSPKGFVKVQRDGTDWQSQISPIQQTPQRNVEDRQSQQREIYDEGRRKMMIEDHQRQTPTSPIYDEGRRKQTPPKKQNDAESQQKGIPASPIYDEGRRKVMVEDHQSQQKEIYDEGRRKLMIEDHQSQQKGIPASLIYDEGRRKQTPPKKQNDAESQQKGIPASPIYDEGRRKVMVEDHQSQQKEIYDEGRRKVMIEGHQSQQKEIYVEGRRKMMIEDHQNQIPTSPIYNEGRRQQTSPKKQKDAETQPASPIYEEGRRKAMSPSVDLKRNLLPTLETKRKSPTIEEWRRQQKEILALERRKQISPTPDDWQQMQHPHPEETQAQTLTNLAEYQKNSGHQQKANSLLEWQKIHAKQQQREPSSIDIAEWRSNVARSPPDYLKTASNYVRTTNSSQDRKAPSLVDSDYARRQPVEGLRPLPQPDLQKRTNSSQDADYLRKAPSLYSSSRPDYLKNAPVEASITDKTNYARRLPSEATNSLQAPSLYSSPVGAPIEESIVDQTNYVRRIPSEATGSLYSSPADQSDYARRQPATSQDHQKRSPSSETNSSVYSSNAQMTTNVLVHVDSHSPQNRSVTPVSRSTTPVTLRSPSNVSLQRTPPKHEIRQSVEAFCWKELKKMKEQEDIQMQIQLSNYGYLEDPIISHRSRSISPGHARNTRRSSSLPREVQRQRRLEDVGRTRGEPVYGQRVVYNPNFVRNSPQRNTIGTSTVNNGQRPIFKRGSLSQNYNNTESQALYYKKVGFHSPQNPENPQAWPTKNGYTQSPPQRRLEIKREALSVDDEEKSKEPIYGGKPKDPTREQIFLMNQQRQRQMREMKEPIYDFRPLPNEQLYRQNPEREPIYGSRQQPIYGSRVMPNISEEGMSSPRNIQRNHSFTQRYDYPPNQEIYGRLGQKVTTVNNKVCDIYGKIDDGQVQKSGVLYGQLQRNTNAPPTQYQSYNQLQNQNFTRGTRLTASVNDMNRYYHQDPRFRQQQQQQQQHEPPDRPLPPIPNNNKYRKHPNNSDTEAEVQRIFQTKNRIAGK